MERLTRREQHCADPKEIYGVSVKDHDYISAANRLADYEDTGLTPEEVERSKLEIEAGCVKAIARTYGIDINRLRKLAGADREGCLIIVDNTTHQISSCDTCESGWGTATITGYDSCFNHCEKLAEYRKQETTKDE